VTFDYQAAKLWAMAVTGLDKDALHIHVALILFLAVAVIGRWPLRSWRPWLAVLAACVVGELLDMHANLVDAGQWDWRASRHDLVNTMVWPTILTLLARFGRLKRLF